MLLSHEVALQTAELLLKIKAVKLSPKAPFTWASGIQSPIYCDNRITLSFPEIRTFIRQQFGTAIREHFEGAEAIAGVATGGIAQGALVAQELGLPFSYVRSGKKEHGLSNQIEGRVEEGQRIVVVEDLISTGGSSLSAVAALREAGCLVTGMVAIFTYNLPVSIQKFKEANCELVTLSDYDVLIEKALATGYVNDDDLKVLNDFKNAF
ncbi:MAG: orotate phosphoribosyltransferase [Bacteroidales bacterium]|nr:orotate phosphoribosyltransferase [Bacteroidales bacterium]